MFRVNVVGDGFLNKKGGITKESRKGREGIAQNECGWQRELEQNGRGVGRMKERKGKICSV